MVVFSLIFPRNGGFFVDFSSNWWFFRRFFVEMVGFSLIVRRSGGSFVDVLSKWWSFYGFGGFFLELSS